jgi:molecular chaperone GrpE
LEAPVPADTPEPTDSVPLTPEDAGSQAKIDQLEKQVGDYKLLVAELQTSMRRLTQDADRQRKYAGEGLVRDLLGGLDNLGRAAEAAKKAGDGGPLAQGVAATIALFLDILKRHGVTRIEVGPGSAFDPNLHQAVSQQPGDGVPPGHVASVLQQGFVLHDRVIRPASVVVTPE